ncbi:MAG: ComEC/Rec2 family competence protein [Pseudanabaenaceae cyanobacterium]
MQAKVFLIWCTAFVAGAYTSATPNNMGFILCLAVGGLLAWVLPRYWKDSPPYWVYVTAGVIGALACGYVFLRTPVPAPTDIANFAPIRSAIVRGVIANAPSLNRSGRVRFHLAVEGFKKSERDREFTPATGSLYVTVPMLEGTGRHRGDGIEELRGSVYKPSGASNPGGFDFRQFLARQGIFAGMAGRSIKPEISPPRFGEWLITKRVVQAHVTGAGMPEGALLSSFVLGGRAVDLPADLRDTFVKAGLAAMLAASGFHVAIILATALAAIDQNLPKQRLIVGSTALVGYAILTGGSPSIIRAAIMGIGGLAGLAYERKVRPLVGLAAAAVLLLLWQPMWIYDLGFQFSFLATFGLMVSANPIQQKLDWLPPNLAGALAVPIAAVLWTLPLQLYVFGRISIYSILANLLTTPLISFCIIGGVLAGIGGVLFLPLGAGLSWLLKFPLWLTIRIAEFTNSLPGAITNTGTIDLWQLLIVYAIFIVVWLVPKPQWLPVALWMPAGMLSIVLLFAPGALARANLFQVMVMDMRVQAMLIQNRGQTALINSGSANDVQYTIYPYLQREGINRIETGIATNPEPRVSEGWQNLIREGIHIKELKEVFTGDKPLTYQQIEQALRGRGTVISSLSEGQKIDLLPEVAVEILSVQPRLLKITTRDTVWLLLGTAKEGEQRDLVRSGKVVNAQVLWWTGTPLLPELVRAVKPQFLIASGTIRREAREALTPQTRGSEDEEATAVRILTTGRDGAIIWTPANGLETLKDAEDSGSAF